MADVGDIRRLLARSTDSIVDLVDDVIFNLRESNAPGWDAISGLEDRDVRPVMRGVFEEFLRSLTASEVRMSPGGRDTLNAAIRLRRAHGASLSDMLRSHSVGGAGIWRHIAGQVGTGVAESRTLIEVTPRVFELEELYNSHLGHMYGEAARAETSEGNHIQPSTAPSILLAQQQVPVSVFWQAIEALHIPHRGWFLVVSQRKSATVRSLEHVQRLAPVVASWTSAGRDTETALLSLRGNARIEDVVAGAHSTGGTFLGASELFTAIECLPAMCRQANLALSSTSSQQPLVRFDRDVLDVLLGSAPEATNSLIRHTLGWAPEASLRRVRELASTVQAYLQFNRSVEATAAAMNCHRNTITYRLRRFEELTGGSFADGAWVTQVSLILLSPLGLDRLMRLAPAPRTA